MHPMAEAARRAAEREARRAPGFSLGRQSEESDGGGTTVIVGGRAHGMTELGGTGVDDDSAAGDTVILLGPRHMPVRVGPSPWYRGA